MRCCGFRIHASGRFALRLLVVSLAVVVSAPGRMLDPSYAIVFETAPFGTPAEAAGAESQIDWSGSDAARMSACTRAFAAQELRHYLCALAGVSEKAPAAFRIQPLNRRRVGKAIELIDLAVDPAGRTRPAVRLTNPGSFALVPKGQRLLIVGRDRTGVLYGVYALLERAGVRWYAPGTLGEVVPRNALLSLPERTIIEEPKFLTRGFFSWEDRGRDNREFFLWMARNRLNLWTVAEPNRALLKKLGMRLSGGSHWTFQRFLDPKKYFEAHPEWYGLNRGKRTGFNEAFGTNICTSNAEAVRELSRNLIRDLAGSEWHDLDLFDFWPLDNGKWCECENCRRIGPPTERLLALVEQVRGYLAAARRQGVLKRDITIVFPIYHETEPAPERPILSAQGSPVIGTYFPIPRCYVHTIDDPRCTEYNTKVWDVLLAWRKKSQNYHGDLEIGEYYNVSTSHSLPALYTNTMPHDIGLYYANGVRHFHYMHVYTDLLGPKRINNYLMARLLWNPDVDGREVVAAYLKDFYGPAAGPMARFYERLEYAMSSIKQWKHYASLVQRINRDSPELFPTEHLKLKEYHPAHDDGVDLEESVRALEECRRIMDGLLEQQWAGQIRPRLLEDDRNLRYGDNTVLLYYYMAQAILARRSGDGEQARELYRKTIPLARALEQEIEIVQTAGSHANAKNGLEASGIRASWEKLAGQLGVER